MKTSSTVCRTTSRFLRRLLGISLGVWLLGFPFVQAQASVTVDQQPLIVQKPLPPNIVLMLDDSGSMLFDVMPDSVARATQDARINASVNEIYYNPKVTYTPPPKVDGTPYPNASLTSAWINGFDQSQGTVNLTAYDGSKDVSNTYYNGSAITYSKYTDNKNYYTFNYRDQCAAQMKSEGGTSYDWGWVFNGYNYYNCVVHHVTPGYFRYATGSTNTVYYVAASSCGSQTNCVTAGDTSGAAAPAGVPAGQNVANWYAYYHTRILMAKSGLLSAFSTVRSSFRVGFGSINNSESSYIQQLPYSSKNGVDIADVAPLGDGSTGTQKYRFWYWVTHLIPPHRGTPLRDALDAVGQYYQSTQPWQTSSTDGTELACRQSYTILTTDGFWNGSSPKVGDVDSTDGSQIKGPNLQKYTYIAAPPYSDGVSNTLADVAMKYWMNDLQPGINNEVPPSKEDPAFWQHMTTFTLGLGYTPTGISPSGTTVDQIFSWANGGTAISNFSWPTPQSNSINNIADLAHAAVDGHGGFYSANSPQSFASGLSDALKRATSRVGSGASLAANSTDLKTGTMIYQGVYYTAKWKGDLKAYTLNPTTGAVSTDPTWKATAMMPAWNNRTIYTYNPDGKNANQQYVSFSSPGSLSTAEQDALGNTTTDQQNMINYLRGDSAMEQSNTGGIYRDRETPLGDIVDSQPVYVGSPDPNAFVGETFTGSSDYAAFASNQDSRKGLVYVAANDGMLHAFDASSGTSGGTEVFAYLPAGVITHGLKDLSNPDYGSIGDPHQYYNDGELTVADAYISGAWKTVLVGTTGRGPAEDVYALDITDPTNIKLLWERWAGDGKTNSNYIGQMVGKPVIAQTADGSWSVLIGNGYNSPANVAALLQFNLADGSLTVHKTDTTTDNGLAAPVTWLNDPGNGISNVAYAGDLKGRVWSFSLYNGTTATPSSTGTRLFTATDSSGNAQPITAGMLAGKNPDTGNVWLFFGTGRYLSTNDLTDKSVQTWYGTIVQSSDPSLITNLQTKGRDSLVQRKILAQTAATNTTLGTRAVTQLPTPSDMTGKSGWYMDLVAPDSSGSYTPQGERMVTPNQFQGDLLLGITRIPDGSDLCNPSGTGWIMAVDPFTGTNPQSNFFDTNGDGQINSADEVALGNKKVASAGSGYGSAIFNPTVTGNVMNVGDERGGLHNQHIGGGTGTPQRVSWRELVNQ